MALDDPSDPRLEAALARISEQDTELQAARRSVADLKAALETNREIGAAIGVVMVTRGVDTDEAFDLLRQASQARHTKLRAIAQEVVALRRLVAVPAGPTVSSVGQRPVPGPPRPVADEEKTA